MPVKNYKDYVELLKSREARPSFERTKAIIESRGNESPAYFANGSQTRNWAIGIAAFSLFALIAIKIAVNNSPNVLPATKTASKAMTVSQSSQVFAQSENPTSKASLRGIPEGRSKEIEGNSKRISADRKRSVDHQRSMDGPVITSGLLANTEEINLTLANTPKDHPHTEDSLPVPCFEYVQPRTINAECEAEKDIPIPLPLIIVPGKDNIPSNRFFVSLNGSFSQELNSFAANSKNSLDGFLGVGYSISSRLSVGLVGGRETFVKKQPSYSTSFTDTNFVHNGKPYQNIIGHIDTGSTPQPTQMYSIGGSLRYTFGDSYSSPYAEVTGGASNDGAIAGATIGLSIFHFDFLSIDAGAFIRSLFSPTSSPLTKFGASLELQYDM
jgi:hypothetical protein